MNSILVPVDGSKPSLNALKAAITSAKKAESALHVVTVQPPIFSGNVTRFIDAETLADYYKEEGEKALVAAKQLLQSENIQAKTEVAVGPIAETVARLVTEYGCDLVVMGTRGMSSVSNLLLGSVATKVLNSVNVPVMLVK